jgi:hypothetical protein
MVPWLNTVDHAHLHGEKTAEHWKEKCTNLETHTESDVSTVRKEQK